MVAVINVTVLVTGTSLPSQDQGWGSKATAVAHVHTQFCQFASLCTSGFPKIYIYTLKMSCSVYVVTQNKSVKVNKVIDLQVIKYFLCMALAFYFSHRVP